MDELRFDIDCIVCGIWVEIDVVNIVGTLRLGNIYIVVRNYINLLVVIKIIRNIWDFL